MNRTRVGHPGTRSTSPTLLLCEALEKLFSGNESKITKICRRSEYAADGVTNDS